LGVRKLPIFPFKTGIRGRTPRSVACGSRPLRASPSLAWAVASHRTPLSVDWCSRPSPPTPSPSEGKGGFRVLCAFFGRAFCACPGGACRGLPLPEGLSKCGRGVFPLVASLYLMVVDVLVLLACVGLRHRSAGIRACYQLGHSCPMGEPAWLQSGDRSGATVRPRRHPQHSASANLSGRVALVGLIPVWLQSGDRREVS
jgi:hypothetical protein